MLYVLHVCKKREKESGLNKDKRRWRQKAQERRVGCGTYCGKTRSSASHPHQDLDFGLEINPRMATGMRFLLPALNQLSLVEK